MPNINTILRKHHNAMIQKNSDLKESFADPPMAAFRQPINLRRLLCKSKMFPNKSKSKVLRTQKPGWKNCKKPCVICPLTMEPTDKIVGISSKYEHKINDFLDCNTTNCIYYWKCIKVGCKDYPKCEYIGKTKRSFKARYSEHRDYIKSENINEPSGLHFNKPGHSISDMKGLVIEKVKSNDPFILDQREHLYIKLFDTYKNGLNKEP